MKAEIGSIDEWMDKKIAGGWKPYFHLFDSCIDEMLVLMGGSMRRFKGTPEYLKLQKEMLVE